MRTLSFNLNPPIPKSNSQLKSVSSNLYLGHIRTGISSQSVPLRSLKSRIKSLSSSSSSYKEHIRRFSSQPVLAAGFDTALSNSTPISSSTYSGMKNYSQPVVIPTNDAQPKVVAIDSFDPQPVVPVPLPISDAFCFPYEDFILHNKLMLQNQHFLKGHTNKNHSLISTTHQNLHPNLYRHSFCFVGYGSYLLAGCCDNLILVCFYDKDRSCPREALWNLSTNELKFLPDPDFPRSLFHHCRVIHTSIRSYGFGFDPLSKDYKVLRFVEFCFEDDTFSSGSEFMELYSLKTDSWKKVTNPSPGNVSPSVVPSVFINGFYYWKADFVEDGYLSQTPIILSFDFASEKFSHIPDLILPHDEDVYELFVDYDLVEFDGSLAALLHSELESSSKTFTFEIWVWSGNESSSSSSSSWAQIVPAIHVPATYNIVTIVGLFDKDKLFLHNTDKELLCFNCATRELENLGIHDNPRRLWFNTKK